VAKLRTARREGGIDYLFYCPGCRLAHTITVRDDGGHPSWSFDGDQERPTFTPSLLIHEVRAPTDEEAARILAGEYIAPTPVTCHSFVEAGKIRFLDDCTHDLRGRTVDLPDWPEGWNPD
jgi:hypothetical protein